MLMLGWSELVAPLEVRRQEMLMLNWGIQEQVIASDVNEPVNERAAVNTSCSEHNGRWETCIVL